MHTVCLYRESGFRVLRGPSIKVRWLVYLTIAHLDLSCWDLSMFLFVFVAGERPADCHLRIPQRHGHSPRWGWDQARGRCLSPPEGHSNSRKSPRRTASDQIGCEGNRTMMWCGPASRGSAQDWWCPACITPQNETKIFTPFRGT